MRELEEKGNLCPSHDQQEYIYIYIYFLPFLIIPSPSHRVCGTFVKTENNRGIKCAMIQFVGVGVYHYTWRCLGRGRQSDDYRKVYVV